MAKAFITMSAGNIKADIERVNGNLDKIADAAIAATAQAMGEVANDMLSIAQSKINVRSGELQASGLVEEPTIASEEILVRWGFNSPYARIRDQGGDIFPVRGTMLAIPLDAIMTATGPRFASPREEPNLELVPILQNLYLADKDTGEFHWLLTPHVHQEGNRFVSGTVQEEAPNVVPKIAERVGQMLERSV